MGSPEYFRAQAAKCRDLASRTHDEGTAANLRMLATDYEEEARKLEAGPDAEPPIPPLK